MDLLKIVVFAVIAAILVLRLRSVLGRRTGHERPPHDPFVSGTGPRDAGQRPPRLGGSDKVATVSPHDRGRPADMDTPEATPERAAAPEEPRLAAALDRIQTADPGFDLEEFTAGANAAFEMIISAFAGGDKETLQPLLAKDVYENFAAAIDERQAAKQSLETNIVSMRSSDIIEAALEGHTAVLTVKFVSEQVNVTRDSENRIVAGDPNQIATVTDIWTFARDTKSRSPNWSLVATDGSN